MPNISDLTVIMRSKDQILFNGHAFAVSSINEKGVFDILSQHENFISILKEKVIIHLTPKQMQEIQIENGVLRVFKDKVQIYVNFKS